MLSREALESIKKEVDALKQRRTELFTQEITNSPAYKKMFPRVISIINDNEKKLVESVDSFERLSNEIISYRYEVNSDKCANDFIVELENVLSQMESLISEINWTK